MVTKDIENGFDVILGRFNVPKLFSIAWFLVLSYQPWPICGITYKPWCLVHNLHANAEGDTSGR
jgi:hypothetical protein